MKANSLIFLFAFLVGSMASAIAQTHGRIESAPHSAGEKMVRMCNECHHQELNRDTTAPNVPAFVGNPSDWRQRLDSKDRPAELWLRMLKRTVERRHRMPPEGWWLNYSSQERQSIGSALSDLRGFLKGHSLDSDESNGRREAVEEGVAILDKERLEHYRELVTGIRTEIPDLRESLRQILQGKSALLYDRDVMPQLYQSPPSGIVKLEHAGSNGRRIVGNLGPLFFKGGEFRHPFGRGFGVPAGTETFFAMLLPVDANGRKKSVRVSRGSTWTWEFPTETRFFEFIAHGGRIFEIRERELVRADGGRTRTLFNIYRQFPSKATLIQQIAKLRPAWKADPQVRRLLETLKQTHLTEQTVGDDGYQGKFLFSGFQETLPSMPNDLVSDLRDRTDFVSSVGTYWAKDGQGRLSFAPTGADDRAIVPKGYQAHAFAISSRTCVQCHNQIGTPFASYFPHYFSNLYLYGGVWGGGADVASGNGIFSWHPFDPSRSLPGDDSRRGENRAVRLSFLEGGVVEVVR